MAWVVVAASRNVQYVGICCAAALAIVGFFATFTSFTSNLPVLRALVPQAKTSRIVSHGPWLASMMKDVVAHQNLTDNPPLRELCESTTWHPGAYVMCDDNPGGLGNVGSMLLGCARIAIHAGAGLIVPKILIRHPEVLTILEYDYSPLSYMFNQTHFETMLRTNCPKMIVLADAGMINRLFKAQIPPLKVPDFLGSNPSSPGEAAAAPKNASMFQAELYDGLQPALSVENPALIRIKASILNYPAHILDSSQVFASFGKLLVFNDDIYELAESIYSALRKRSSAYLGVHLRTEADTPRFWATYEWQRNRYLNASLKHNFSTMYIASGDPVGIETLRQAAKEHNIECLSKDDLLSNEDRLRLNNLRWDLRALVDYLILLKSDFFSGGVKSSFDYLLAASRHITIDQTPFPFPQDALSELVGGRVTALFETGIWPLWA